MPAPRDPKKHPHLFQPGNKLAANRGASALTKTVKQMVADALDLAGGTEYLVTQAKTNPRAFLTLVAKLIPTEQKVTMADDSQVLTAIATILPRFLPQEDAQQVLDELEAALKE